MTLTLEDIPAELDALLRQRAAAEGKSVNQIAVDALRAALTTSEPVGKRVDLSDIAGTWIEDPEVDAALRDQDRVDPELWR